MQRDSGIGGITIGPVSRSRGHGAANGHHGHGVVGSMGDMIIGNQVCSQLQIFFVFYKYFPLSRPWTWMLSYFAASNSRSPPDSPLTAACAGLPWRIGKGEKIFFIRLQIFLPCGYIQQPGGERRVRALAAADPEQDADGHGEAAQGHHRAHRDGENIRQGSPEPRAPLV